MGVLEIILLGTGLAMDATTAAMTNGMADCKMKLEKSLFIALTFGVFQGLMPIFGYYSGRLFSDFIAKIDNYLAFIILLFLGIRMIIESFKSSEKIVKVSYSKILLQGFATSIDAFIAGLTLAITNTPIYLAALIISLVTFLLSFIAIYLGCLCGNLIKNKAQIFGGALLIALAFWMLK